MKNIIFTVSNDLNYDQRMQKICNTLSKNGFQVLLIGFKKKNSKPLTDQDYNQLRLPLIFQKGKLFYLEINLRLFFKILFAKVNVITAVDMDTIMPCWFVSALRQKKLVLDAHEYFSETSGLVGRPFEKSMWQMIERFFIPKVDQAYTVGLSLASVFERNFNTKFNVLRNVPLHRDFKISTEAKPDYYLYQGALNKGRGLEMLINVFANNHLKLKIAGDGPLMEYLSSKIAAYQIGDRVELLGWLAPNDLHQLTANAKAGLNLIDNQGLSYYLSLANKFFDYIHSEIPQICMDYPEYRNICNEHSVAVLIPTLSENEIQNALKELEENTALYFSMKNTCKEASKVYNWQNEENVLLTIYDQLV